MDAKDLLADAFGRIRSDVEDVVADLDLDALTYRPDAEANPIGWLVWHATRVQDDHICELAGVEQRWTADGWVGRFGFALPASDTGFGHDADQVAAVRPAAPDLLVGYHAAVADGTLRYLSGLDTAELDRVIDDAWDPPVTAGVRLVSVVHDGMQHLGQAAYVRGLLERR